MAGLPGMQAKAMRGSESMEASLTDQTLAGKARPRGGHGGG